jgi:methyl-accepting chemotaxis protein
MQNLTIDINLLREKFPNFQQAKDYVYQSVDSLTKSAQQVGESWKQTATTATDKAIDSVTTTVEQAKSSLEQSWQTADQIKNTTSRAVESAIASSMNDWITQHPAIFRIVQVLVWGSNHPIISYQSYCTLN